MVCVSLVAVLPESRGGVASKKGEGAAGGALGEE